MGDNTIAVSKCSRRVYESYNDKFRNIPFNDGGNWPMGIFQNQQSRRLYFRGRSLGPWVTALSAAASDMSGWALLGLPGAVYANGLKETWMIFGLIMGAYYNWTIVAPRLRVYTEHLNVLTIPEYLEKRLQTETPYLKIISSLIILGFFTFYTASGLVAGAKLFSSSFGFDYNVALLIGTSVILLYTVTGGFLAVSWTDFIQGILMAGALVVVPSVLYFDIVGFDVNSSLNEKSFLSNISFSFSSFSNVLGLRLYGTASYINEIYGNF